MVMPLRGCVSVGDAMFHAELFHEIFGSSA